MLKELDKKNLFIVRTPLQLFNAIEAKKRFHKKDGEEDNILFYQYQRQVDKELMENLIVASEWDEVIAYPLSWSRRIFLAFYLKPIMAKHNKIENCYVGAFNSIVNLFINTIKPNKTIILDDGTKTLGIANNIARGDVNRKENQLKTLRNKLFNLDRSYMYESSFFTIYTLQSYQIENEIVLNDYREFKRGLASYEQEDVVYFIGTNLIEKILKSKDAFEKNLEKLLEYYQGKKLIYILHRYEDFKYLQKLAKKHAFEAVKFENILEVEIANAGFIPVEFATFGSSAIETLPLLFSQSSYRVFKLQAEDILAKKEKAMENVYLNFEKKGYEVIAL